MVNRCTTRSINTELRFKLTIYILYKYYKCWKNVHKQVAHSSFQHFFSTTSLLTNLRYHSFSATQVETEQSSNGCYLNEGLWWVPICSKDSEVLKEQGLFKRNVVTRENCVCNKMRFLTSHAFCGQICLVVNQSSTWSLNEKEGFAIWMCKPGKNYYI